MQLLDYLNDNFISLSQLLSASGASEQELRLYQLNGMMPKASYVLNLHLSCNSFFGHHQEQTECEYYAKGYLYWLGIVQANADPEFIYQAFSQRYQQTLDALKAQGYQCNDEKLSTKLAEHIESEWQHFLSGSYGLCTRSGLPENIAAKELAIAQINELTRNENLGANELSALTKAVDLLDKASACFAPHERQRSSRHRLVDEVRRQYQLVSPM
ncbi:hypothetical protein PA25_36930 [Pseudoalteromonas sp. A25]|uniref:DUF6058 family natural product biosynthesis protein n=1 Tax=Pseudoalteromonas sp. A25 TaxID=116092 RepID=UPI0012613409|nr:DUF6058 family natural product biosynthesis protein [Pseudoalteromonas sp. A25]BBN83708.1 hypothetical protein PA25_36930 [Pseudoalteromonas sp. A25]